MTAKLSRYLFDTSFDVEDADAAIDGGAAAVEGTPAPSTYTEDDLKAARDEALASGEAAGREAALGAVESQLQEALDRLVRQVGRLLEDQRRFNGEVVEQAVRMALKVVRKMLPELARRNGLAEIEAVLRRCLADVPDEPRIVVASTTRTSTPAMARPTVPSTSSGSSSGMHQHAIPNSFIPNESMKVVLNFWRSSLID